MTNHQYRDILNAFEPSQKLPLSDTRISEMQFSIFLREYHRDNLQLKIVQITSSPLFMPEERSLAPLCFYSVVHVLLPLVLASREELTTPILNILPRSYLNATAPTAKQHRTCEHDEQQLCCGIWVGYATVVLRQKPTVRADEVTSCDRAYRS